MTPMIRYPLGSIPGIATVVVCAFTADFVMHQHIPVHAFQTAVRMLDGRP